MNTTTRPLYVALATAAQARLNCQADLDAGTAHESVLALRAEWLERWTERLKNWTREHMPSGSGFDSGTTLNLDESTGEKLIFETAFHHMNQVGFYDGWTSHRVTVRPSLAHGFALSIGGRNRNGIKDYIAETFQAALAEPVDSEGTRAPARRSGPIACRSVPAGWQSEETESGRLFGPIFNAIRDLWDWQKSLVPEPAEIELDGMGNPMDGGPLPEHPAAE